MIFNMSPAYSWVICFLDTIFIYLLPLYILGIVVLKNSTSMDFPGGLVVEPSNFQCKGVDLIPG